MWSCLSLRVPLVPLAVQLTFFAYICVPTTESYTVSIFSHIVCVQSPSSTLSNVSAFYQEYINVYYIVFPVYHRLTLTQCQKHFLCYHIFSNTTGKHCIFAINKHKGKRHYTDDLKENTCLSRQVPLIQPSPTLYCYLTLTHCQNICTVFFSDYFG